MSKACYWYYLDASALVKLVVNEPGVNDVRRYFNTNSGACTTFVSFVEALGVLKRKWQDNWQDADYQKAPCTAKSWSLMISPLQTLRFSKKWPYSHNCTIWTLRMPSNYTQSRKGNIHRSQRVQTRDLYVQTGILCVPPA